MPDPEPSDTESAIDGSAILAALAEDDDHLCVEESELLRETDRSEARATATAPLERVNRSNLRALLANVALPYNLRGSLINFLHRYKLSKWMKGQKNYPQRISISLVAEWSYGKAMAMCGVNHWFCQQADYCPQCANMLRYKAALYEYGDCFDKAPFWYALSASFNINANRAGLRYVTQKKNPKKGIPEKVRRLNPYQGGERGVALTSDAHLIDGANNPVIACFTTIFQLAAKLVKSELAGGVYAHREVAWHFQPHRVTPNGHFLVNTPVPLTFEMARGILILYERLYNRQPLGRHLYPDLHIEALLSQREINRWLFYMSKPMDFVTGYLRAARAGVDIAALNMEVDDRVFQGGAVILSPKSPRRYGNLNSKIRNKEPACSQNASLPDQAQHTHNLRNTAKIYIGAGSVTTWRLNMAKERKAKRERLGLPDPRPPAKESRLSRIIDREAHRRTPEV